MAGYRTGRVSENIKREIVAVIRELKDPRVRDKILTVVRVDVSSDLSFAKVYVSSMSGIEDAKEAVKGLTNATGLIRREVGNKLHLRKTPELKFIDDNSIEHGMEKFKKIESTTITSDEE